MSGTPESRLVAVSEDPGHTVCASRPLRRTRKSEEELPQEGSYLEIEELCQSVKIHRVDRGCAYFGLPKADVERLYQKHGWDLESTRQRQESLKRYG